MYRQIFKNLLSKKPAIPYPEGITLSPEDEETILKLRKRIDSVFNRSLKIRQVDGGSCNACEWECTALTNPFYDIQRFGIDFVASPRHADVLLVTGPVSRQMALAIKKTYIATPEPRLVIACGDCAVDGGIYRGSYAVTDGLSNVIPVDFYIRGCPPSPMQIITGLKEFIDMITDKN